MQPKTVRSLILNPLRCRIGSTAPDSCGSRNLVACHALQPRVSRAPRPPQWLLDSRRRRAGLGLAVADNAGDDQVGVVHDGAERDGQRVAQLSALVDGAGSLGIDVAARDRR